MAAMGFWTLTMWSAASPWVAARSAASVTARIAPSLPSVPTTIVLNITAPLSALAPGTHFGNASLPAAGYLRRGRSPRASYLRPGVVRRARISATWYGVPSGRVTVPRSCVGEVEPWKEMWARPSQTT